MAYPPSSMARGRSRSLIPVLTWSLLSGMLAPVAWGQAPAVELPDTQPPEKSPPSTPARVLPELPALAEDPRIFPETGRPVATWRPAVQFDFLHMKLEIDFPDLGVPVLVGRETLTARAVGKPRDQIRLDAVKMNIRSVTMGGKPLAFAYDQKELNITLPGPVAVGQEVQVVIEYDVDFGYCKGQGLTWSAPKPGAESPSDQVIQIHSQGQAQDNSRWFICHDFPNDKLTTELIVTAEEGYDVSSNGRLLSKAPAGPGRTRWHWMQDKPHATYLVTLVVGKFSIVELGGPGSARPGLDIPVYTPIGTEEDARRLYRNTPAMIAHFEKIFDEPFPWDRYAQLICRDFVWGGMENTSATTMTRGSLYGEDGSQDGLIAHELGHQWFGDLITCKGWEHLWLNEGWASFCEALWDEEAAGDQPAQRRRAYQRVIARFLAGQRVRNTSSAPDAPALVSNRYTEEMQVMGKPDDVYGKGALVLHMLRMRLGDEAFFAGTRLYLDRFKFQHATSDDFRRALEDASGQNLDRFFTQWTLRPGLPRLGISYEFDEQSRQLKIEVEQTQRVDADNPAYAFSLPFYVRYPSGGGEYLYIDTDVRKAEATFEIKERPSGITVDPRLTVAAPHTVVKEMEFAGSD